MRVVELRPLEAGRLDRAKASYTTRRVPIGTAKALVTGVAPRPGDVLLARVIEIGQHSFVESGVGRRATIFPGDEVVVCYGSRYAPDQFEAEVPPVVSTCHLVAGGGIAATVLSWHQAMRPPTVIEPVGLLADEDGRRLNLANCALPPLATCWPRPFTLAVVGTSMNAGKTTGAANAARGLLASGLPTGAGKVTGTGAGKDLWLMRDAGARPVLDFTDAGFPSTYRVTPQAIEGILQTLLGHLRAADVAAIVLEIADGLYQPETASLVASRAFADSVDAVLFAASDAMGAAAGVAWLRERGLNVVAVTGVLTASPLAIREAEHATRLPVLTPAALATDALLRHLGIATRRAVVSAVQESEPAVFVSAPARSTSPELATAR
ncbi:MAG: DUF1611 domain-containing protein [Chloroflexota bacterium]|nr:DUF1611 domain-containing protein [Chloroflexota bacterium]